jgi:isopenicillin N synthase-like dioxygenase
MAFFIAILNILWIVPHFAILSRSNYGPKVIDVAPLLELQENQKPNEQQQKLQQDIDESLQENGLLILTGHGMTIPSSNTPFASAYELFGLSAQAKSDVLIKNDNSSFGRGFIGFGAESGLASHFEPKEGYSYGSAANAKKSSSLANLLSVPNKWPRDLGAEHVAVLENLYDQNVRMARVIVSALSAQFVCDDLGEPSFSLSSRIKEKVDTSLNIAGNSKSCPNSRIQTINNIISGGADISLMRMFHYYNINSTVVREHHQRTVPRAQRQDEDEDPPTIEKEILGSSPHTDWGFLTLILADDVRGLQFIPKRLQQRKGAAGVTNQDWVDVPYVPGSLVVNGGDYLSMISHGVYHSPIHRVVIPGAVNQHHRAIKVENQNVSLLNSIKIDMSGDREGNLLKGDADEIGSQQQEVMEKEEEEARDSCLSADATSRICNSKDRYSFVFFFYPSYTSPMSDSALDKCCVHRSKRTQGSIKDDTDNDAISFNSVLREEYFENDVVEDVASNSEQLKFNTLLDMRLDTYVTDGSTKSGSAEQGNEIKSFGDYVVQKWRDVYRN